MEKEGKVEGSTDSSSTLAHIVWADGAGLRHSGREMERQPSSAPVCCLVMGCGLVPELIKAWFRQCYTYIHAYTMQISVINVERASDEFALSFFLQLSPDPNDKW